MAIPCPLLPVPFVALVVRQQTLHTVQLAFVTRSEFEMGPFDRGHVRLTESIVPELLDARWPPSRSKNVRLAIKISPVVIESVCQRPLSWTLA